MKTLIIILALIAAAAVAGPKKITEKPTAYTARYVAATNSAAVWAKYTNDIAKAKSLSDVQAAALALGTAKEAEAKAESKPKKNTAESVTPVEEKPK